MPEGSFTRASRPDEVDEYMRGLDHPLKDVLEAIRRVLLETDPTVGEEIKWNAPTFFYTGGMPPSDAKEFARYLVVTNLFRKDQIRLVFWGGANVNDTSGFLHGDYRDGRRLASFSSLEDVRSKQELLRHVVREQLRLLRG